MAKPALWRIKKERKLQRSQHLSITPRLMSNLTSPDPVAFSSARMAKSRLNSDELSRVIFLVFLLRLCRGRRRSWEPLEGDRERQENSERCAGKRESKDVLDTRHVSLVHSSQVSALEDVGHFRCTSGQDLDRIYVGSMGSKFLEHVVGEDGLCSGDKVSTTNGVAHWS